MKHSLLLFYRNMTRNKTFSIITITGFTLSLTVVLLLSAYVLNEMSYDRHFSKIDRIYRLIEGKDKSELNEDAIEYISHDFPEIESVCRYNFFINFRGSLTRNGQSVSCNNILHTEASFFDLFDVDFVEGSKETALSDINSIVLTQETAGKMFGDRDPIGQTVTVYHKNDLVVSAVIRSFPVNSSMRPEAIIHRDLKTVTNSYSHDNVTTYFNRYFILVKPGSDIPLLDQKLSAHLTEHKMVKGPVYLLPMKDSYFSTVRNNSHLMHANIKLIRILGGIAALVLLVSMLNFVVLFTAHYMTRIKEIGLKKTIGAGRYTIFAQFISESILIGVVSLSAAILLASLTKPLFESIVDKPFTMSYLYSWPHVLYIPLGLVLISGLAGSFPALLASRFSVLSMFRNMGGHALRIKSGLLTIQYTVSMVLIAALIVISLQMKYVKNKDLGFSTDRLVKIEFAWQLKDKLPLLKQKIKEIPNVYGVTASHGGPGTVYMGWNWQEAAKKGTWNEGVPSFFIDTDFFNVLNVPIIEGRNFTDHEQNNVVIINETARKLIDWDSIEGKRINDWEVIGVVQDFYFENMYNTLEPAFFMFNADNYYTWLTLRLAPNDIPGTLAAVKDAWNEVCPDFVFEYSFYDDWYDTMYKAEERLGFAIKIFAVIAILITCMGTFGVVQFTTRRRSKEVGIRKVNGASVRQIAVLLNTDLLKWTGIAFGIAAPVSWYVMHLWLQSFAYRTALSWWIFLLSGLIALAVAILTTSWQVVRTAMANPIDTLRYE